VPADAAAVLNLLANAAAESTDPQHLGKVLVGALAQQLPHASWVGIYWLRGEELELGPYVGPPTEHTRIPVGRGVCGTAIAEDRDQVVDDVRTRENYLACSATVRSEIVVLIRSHGKVVGQVDMDSEHVGAFGPGDHAAVRALCDAFGTLLPR
jgi:GAF domain-containing protein